MPNSILIANLLCKTKFAFTPPKTRYPRHPSNLVGSGGRCGEGVCARACVCVRGVVTSFSYIWHSADVRAEWLPFLALSGI